MNFLSILQFKTRKFWWLDIVLYFVVSLLVAAIFSYLILIIKNKMVGQQIKYEESALQTVGTQRQKDHETEVMQYKKKIEDFGKILSNHKFASNVFSFMQQQTVSNVRFYQFGMDQKNITIQLQGEADNLDALAKQLLLFENNEFVKNVASSVLQALNP